MPDFSSGRQPCQNYTPKDADIPNAQGFPNRHQCYRCGGLVSFCLACMRDHHLGGYEACVKDDQKEGVK